MLKRDIKAHKAWIMRGYALGIAAGTQVVIFIPWMLILGTPAPLTRELLMGSAWVINLLIVEWILHRKPKRRSTKKII